MSFVSEADDSYGLTNSTSSVNVEFYTRVKRIARGAVSKLQKWNRSYDIQATVNLLLLVQLMIEHYRSARYLSSRAVITIFGDRTWLYGSTGSSGQIIPWGEPKIDLMDGIETGHTPLSWKINEKLSVKRTRWLSDGGTFRVVVEIAANCIVDGIWKGSEPQNVDYKLIRPHNYPVLLHFWIVIVKCRRRYRSVTTVDRMPQQLRPDRQSIRVTEADPSVTLTEINTNARVFILFIWKYTYTHLHNICIHNNTFV